MLNKKDFIEIEFTGRVKDREIFDSNILEDVKKLHEGHSHEIEAKPVIFCLGEGMFLKGIDDFLIGKEVGNYTIELPPEKAFGVRLSQLVQMVPIKLFQSQKLNPIPGSLFNFDGRMAKVLTVSGGRVIVDFNNPLAGKSVVYNINVLRKVEDLNEKIKSVINFLFRRDFQFSVQEKKVIIEVEKQASQFFEMFKEKFKDILDMGLELKEEEEKPKTVQ
jgi:FKBP-type peptidyl-prolyl cis-trans isomerase 2